MWATPHCQAALKACLSVAGWRRRTEGTGESGGDRSFLIHEGGSARAGTYAFLPSDRYCASAVSEG